MILALAVREPLPYRRASSFAVLVPTLLGVALILAAFLTRGGRSRKTPAGPDLRRHPDWSPFPLYRPQIQQRAKFAKCLDTGSDLSEINSICGKSSLGVT